MSREQSEATGYNGQDFIAPESSRNLVEGSVQALVVHIEVPPEPESSRLIAPCTCGAELHYGNFALNTSWLGQSIDVPEAYGWRCTDCDVTLIHPAVGDQIRQAMNALKDDEFPVEFNPQPHSRRDIGF